VDDVTFDFGDHPFEFPVDLPLLTVGAQRLQAVGNPGGSSLLSELVAFEVLARCEGASLLKAPQEVVYDSPGLTTDMLVLIAGRKVGAQVIRAAAYPLGSPYLPGVAEGVLHSALASINESSRNVTRVHAWVKQLLVVVAYDRQHADVTVAAWRDLPETLTNDTVLYVIVTAGQDRRVYTDAP
jgi:hypothetical protein